MNTDPAPDTTLSAEDAGLVREAARSSVRWTLRDLPRIKWTATNLVRIIRDLDAKLVAALRERDEMRERGWHEKMERKWEAQSNRWHERCDAVIAENAALAERLRVAEAHAAAIEDRINALKPFVVHENGAHKVLLHNFDVMVAFFGDKDQPHRWDNLRAALAPTSDAAPKV